MKKILFVFAILSSILGYSEVKHEISVTNGVSVLKGQAFNMTNKGVKFSLPKYNASLNYTIGSSEKLTDNLDYTYGLKTSATYTLIKKEIFEQHSFGILVGPTIGLDYKIDDNKTIFAQIDGQVGYKYNLEQNYANRFLDIIVKRDVDKFLVELERQGNINLEQFKEVMRDKEQAENYFKQFEEVTRKNYFLISNYLAATQNITLPPIEQRYIKSDSFAYAIDFKLGFKINNYKASIFTGIGEKGLVGVELGYQF